MPAYSYQIASGYDNEAGFTNMESLTPTPSGDTYRVGGATSPYFVVRAFAAYRRGQRRFDASGGASFAGYAVVLWTFPRVHSAAWDWLIDNYSGQVTIATTTGVYDSYANYNAIASYSDPGELEGEAGGFLRDAICTLRIVSTT